MLSWVINRKVTEDRGALLQEYYVYVYRRRNSLPREFVVPARDSLLGIPSESLKKKFYFHFFSCFFLFSCIKRSVKLATLVTRLLMPRGSSWKRVVTISFGTNEYPHFILCLPIGFIVRYFFFFSFSNERQCLPIRKLSIIIKLLWILAHLKKQSSLHDEQNYQSKIN